MASDRPRERLKTFASPGKPAVHEAFGPLLAGNRSTVTPRQWQRLWLLPLLLGRQLRKVLPLGPCLPLFGLILFVFMGCKGDNPEQGRSEERSSYFSADDPDRRNTVVLEMVRASENLLTIALTARDLAEPVYGLAVDLVYDPGLFQFAGYRAESFFTDGHQNPVPEQRSRAALLDGKPGRLVVGVARMGAVSGVSGSGRILTFEFRGLGSGNCRFDLENLVCRSPDLESLAVNPPAGGIAWSNLHPGAP